MDSSVTPHGIYSGFDADGVERTQIAYVTPASDEDVAALLAQSTDGHDGRSPYVWVRLHDGTLICGVFPRGDAYMEFSDKGVCDWTDVPTNSRKTADAFEGPEDIRLEGEHFALTLEYIGEGNDGEYDPSDPDDTPLYRFSTERRIEGGWEDVADGSYCTQIPATCSEEQANAAARYLLNQIEMGDGGSLKRLCEHLSWTTLETVLEPA